MPGRQTLPSTLKRSRAHSTAFAALEHSFKKVGDHWEPKREPKRREGPSREELYEQARKLDIAGRSHTSKRALARAVARKQQRHLR